MSQVLSPRYKNSTVFSPRSSKKEKKKVLSPRYVVSNSKVNSPRLSPRRKVKSPRKVIIEDENKSTHKDTSDIYKIYKQMPKWVYAMDIISGEYMKKSYYEDHIFYSIGDKLVAVEKDYKDLSITERRLALLRSTDLGGYKDLIKDIPEGKAIDIIKYEYVDLDNKEIYYYDFNCPLAIRHTDKEFESWKDIMDQWRDLLNDEKICVQTKELVIYDQNRIS